MQFALQRAGDGVVHRVPKFIFDAFSLYAFKRLLCFGCRCFFCFVRSFFFVFHCCSSASFLNRWVTVYSGSCCFFFSSLLILHSFWALLFLYVHFCHHHHPSVPFHICTHTFFIHISNICISVFAPHIIPQLFFSLSAADVAVARLSVFSRAFFSLTFFFVPWCCCSCCFFFLLLFDAFLPLFLSHSLVLYEYVWANKHANIATNKREIKKCTKRNYTYKYICMCCAISQACSSHPHFLLKERAREKTRTKKEAYVHHSLYPNECE